MLWISPLILGLILAAITYFLMVENGDIHSRNFITATMINIIIFIVYEVIITSKYPDVTSKKHIVYSVAVIIGIICVFFISGLNKFEEYFDKESYTVEAVFYKYTKREKHIVGRDATLYMVDVKYKDKNGKEVFKEREVGFDARADISNPPYLYNLYEDGDTVIIKVSDKYPDYFEVVSKK